MVSCVPGRLTWFSVRPPSTSDIQHGSIADSGGDSQILSPGNWCSQTYESGMAQSTSFPSSLQVPSAPQPPVTPHSAAV